MKIPLYHLFSDGIPSEETRNIREKADFIMKCRKFLSVLLALAILLGPAPALVQETFADETLISTATVLGGFLPQAGQTADASCIKVPEGANYTLDPSSVYFWDEDDWCKVDASDVFKAGKKYRLYVLVCPNDGYSFADPADMTAELDGVSDYDTDIHAAGSNSHPNRDLCFIFDRIPGNTTISVSFDANGGDGTMSPATVDTGAAFTVPDCSFTAPTDKEFSCWKYQSNRYFPNDTITPKYDITLQAHWRDIQVGTKISAIELTGGFTPAIGAKADASSIIAATDAPYLLTDSCYFYDEDAEKVLSSTDEFQAGKHYSLDACLAPKENYYFDTLPNMNAVLTGADTSSVLIHEAGGDTADYPNRLVTFYFDILVLSHNVNFDANGHGTAPAAQTVKDGLTASKPDDLTATGWTFGGWYKEEACSNAFDFSTAITSDIVLFAKWTEEIVTPPAPATYTVEVGGNSTWTKGSADVITVTVKRSEADDTCFNHFNGVQIDGATLTASDYEAKAGSTVVTLKAAALEKLSAGSHVIAIIFDDGKAETKVTVNAAESNAADPNATDPNAADPAAPESPKTGDTNNLVLLMALIAVSAFGLCGATLIGRKRRCADTHL